MILSKKSNKTSVSGAKPTAHLLPAVARLESHSSRGTPRPIWRRSNPFDHFLQKVIMDQSDAAPIAQLLDGFNEGEI